MDLLNELEIWGHVSSNKPKPTQTVLLPEWMKKDAKALWARAERRLTYRYSNFWHCDLDSHLIHVWINPYLWIWTCNIQIYP